MIPVDAAPAQYIVVVVHTEYEESVSLFITREAAIKQVNYWQERNAEVYLGKLEAI